MPVVPPVYRSRRSSGERPQGPAAVGAGLHRRLVVDGPVGHGRGAVGHAVPAAHLREAGADAVDQLGEGGVEDDGLGVAVVEQVDDLVGPYR
jgi:hypothetical protein